MALEVTVQIDKLVTICVQTDTPYSPDVAQDLLRRAGEEAVRRYLEVPDVEAAE